ncbi:nuclease-related domain-containing protein [Thalassotalea piscium]|uniref:Transcription elongation factor Elf1 n=1 Tax=Thalassotalea piscium TaxID=1230533 RepID=A0A7X0TSS7_9GAMM|nr:nuclease-related domain-containing protein [Thalassotalea piscium]MBB6542429.1 transcription elongation factor Elf1 [Thalassotalea piscium]
MILKDKKLQNTVSPTAKAGQRQEQDVAFFLRRTFKDHQQVYVINDFKFTHNDETAQIDHLIVYPFGFVLIESKSITGEVKVNDLGEWTRSLNSKWSGMASPIKQVELQQMLLREMLHANRESILGKLLGIKQQSFGMLCWHNVCAVSSNAIIDRDSMPNDVSKQLVKTEFLVDKLNEIMKLKTYAITKLNPFDTRPGFNDEELKSITAFLMDQLGGSKTVEKVVQQEVVNTPVKKVESIADSILQCKSCGEKSDYSAQYGRYGYFIKCNKCETNTAMKTPCVSCSSKNTKVSKKKESYTLNCGDCEQNTVIMQ